MGRSIREIIGDDAVRPGVYDIGFEGPGGMEDETEFDIHEGEGAPELIALWEGFAEEEGVPESAVLYVEKAGEVDE